MAPSGQLEKRKPRTQCLKITEKVAFNITREATPVYILSGEKITKMVILASFDKLKLPI